VTEAYGQLVAEGYLEARTGSATRVRWSNPADDAAAHRAPRPAPAARCDLAPGLPDLRAFPRRRWAEAVRAQTATVAFTELGCPPPGGHPRPRGLLAAYPHRSRGVLAAPEDVTVCTSVTDGVRRLCQVLRARGITAVGCEEPGWTRLREVIRAAGLEPVPVRVDGGGLRTENLHRHPGLRAVLASPAHRFPLGTVLAPERRAALLRWADEVDGVVLEDDYDAEFRYDRRPVAALTSRPSPNCWSPAPTTVIRAPAGSGTGTGGTHWCGRSPSGCRRRRCPGWRRGSTSSCGGRPAWTRGPW